MDHGVVESAVRLDVARAGARVAREGVQGTDLLERVGLQVIGRDVDETPPEPGQIPVAHRRAEGDTAIGCRAAYAIRGAGAGVDAAGDVWHC